MSHKRYMDEIHARLWDWADRNHKGKLDGGNREGRPPVLQRRWKTENVLIAPNGFRSGGIRATLPPKKHHRWFRSLSSSQALTQSLFANIWAYDRLDLLQNIPAECSRPAFFQDSRSWNIALEQEIYTLYELRRTSVDVFLQNANKRIAVECKFTETEFGTCSRTRLDSDDSQYCNGNYQIQQERATPCALTEIGIRYWRHLPSLFDWPADQDHKPCPFGATYQLARNALAAAINDSGDLAPDNGHTLLLYDNRNPEFQAGGKGEDQWQKVTTACRIPGLLRRLSWQRLLASLAEAKELRWLLDALQQKYGLHPDEGE